MALLGLDTEKMELVTKVGALETYEPTDKVKMLCATVDGLRAKMTEFRKAEETFYKEEIIPALNQVRVEIQAINEERYPELKAAREKSEAEAKAKAETK